MGEIKYKLKIINEKTYIGEEQTGDGERTENHIGDKHK